MTSCWHRLFLVWLLAAATLPGAADFEYGPRPPQPVFDPYGLLAPAVVKEISQPLVRIHHDEAVDVLVVVLKDIGAAPPEHVAKRFAAEWCESPLHAVVLHVPGRSGSPWIVPAGRLLETIRPEKTAEAVATATRNAAREPDDAGKVRAAATEAADMLRFWLGTAVNRSEHLETERTRIRLELENRAYRRRIVLLGSAAAAIPLALGVAALFMLAGKRGPRSFPEYRPPRRLGAPHAGGNHAVMRLGPPPPPRKP
jgi:hypothetical protein